MLIEQPALRFRRVDGTLRVPMSAAALLEAARSVEISWEPDARAAVEERRRIALRAPDVLAQVRSLSRERVEAARDGLDRSRLWVNLDEHQVENVARLTVPGGWGGCVFDEQGTGKTVTTIAVFDQLVELAEVDTLFLVGPKSMLGEWHAEFAKYAGDLYDVTVVEGVRSERARQIHAGAEVVVLGYETAVAHEEDLRLLARRSKVLLVVDESFNVKNPAARRTAVLKRLRQRCRRCLVLCGTPAPNSPRDVISQFDLVDLGYAFGSYRAANDLDVDRATIQHILGERGLFTRNLKSRVLPDLPDKTYTKLAVELEPVQRRAYEGALRDLILDLESTGDGTFRRQILSFLERRSALLRICSNPSSLMSDYDQTPAKVAALDELIEEYVGRGEKLVVWSFFRTSLDEIAARYARHGVVRVDGSVSDIARRRESVRAFQEDSDTRIFVGNPAAAGAGITLHSASTAVYESYSNQAAHWMQSLDRIHRRGQRRSCEYIFLVSEDTIEQGEFERIRAKARLQGDLLGDPSSEAPTRERFLEDLLGDRERRSSS
jgi:SNF2 family DNA or RNA helicase